MRWQFHRLSRIFLIRLQFWTRRILEMPCRQCCNSSHRHDETQGHGDRYIHNGNIPASVYKKLTVLGYSFSSGNSRVGNSKGSLVSLPPFVVALR